MKIGKKILSLVLVLIMCLSIVLMANLGIEARAFEDKDYWTEHGLSENQTVVRFHLNGGQIKGAVSVYDVEEKKFYNVENYSGDYYDMVPQGLNSLSEGTRFIFPDVEAPDDLISDSENYGVRFSAWEYSNFNLYSPGSIFAVPEGAGGTIIEFRATYEIYETSTGDNIIDDIFPKDVVVDAGENLSWNFNETTGTLTISGTGPMNDFGYVGNENRIAPWEDFKYDIRSVVISDGVTSVGDKAFGEAMMIENITLGKDIETIGDMAFIGCVSLKEIDIPEGVISIGESAFYACISLNKVVVNNSQTIFEDESIFKTELLPKIEREQWIEQIYNAITAGMNGAENEEELFEILASNTEFFYDEYVIMPNITIYSHKNSTAETYAFNNRILFKTLDEYENENHTCTFGDWYTVTESTVFAQGLERRDCEDSKCDKFETRTTAKLENAVTKDETTKVEITYTDDNFDKAVDVVVIEDKTTSNIAFADEYENFTAYDISLETDGAKVQPNGKVTVKLPIPAGFNAETIAVYYIDNNGNKTLLESKVENGYVVFETDHFSVYAIVDESSKIEEPTEPEKPTVPAEPDTPDTPEDTETHEPCSCNCHAGGIKAFFFKILNFFQKLFGINKICACGVKH